MYLRRIKLKNFRNYLESSAELSRGTNLIIGNNGAGKSNILEAAQYGCCGRSFRTSRETEMVRKGESFFRVGADLEGGGGLSSRSVSYETGNGARIDAGGGPQWLDTGSILCFTPDDLQLIKGPPALRRRFMDEAIARRQPPYRRRILDYQKVLAQRNGFLSRARAGLVKLADISPWDRQLAALSVSIFGARRDYCRSLEPHLAQSYRSITGGKAVLEIRLRSQIEAVQGAEDPGAELVKELEEDWLMDLERGQTRTGSHRDDVEFVLDGKNLRPFGSQGEQRVAVLALLLADRGHARATGAPAPILLLDDVMSELDPDRRRRLMGTLEQPGRGQVLITAADRGLFSDQELEAAAVVEVRGGEVVDSWAGDDV